MQYTKEWIIEVREDIFNQLRAENDLLTQENRELRNMLELVIRLCERWSQITIEKWNLLDTYLK